MPFWHIGARMGIGTVRGFLARMRGRGATRLLDAGTGGGANVFLAAWQGFQVTACDLSFDALAALRRAAAAARPAVSADAVQSDSCRLPFAESTFDVIIASHIIEHLQEPGRLVAECTRVLRPGGILRVSCPSPWHGTRVGLWFGLTLDPEDHVVKGYDAGDIEAMLPAGMHVTRITYQGRFVESNAADAQFLAARALGMSGNPAIGGEAPADPPLWLYLMKECVLLPLLMVAKCEDFVFGFAKGSMISVEIEKQP